MSGIEVAGLVLSALPLCTGLLKDFVEGIDRTKRLLESGYELRRATRILNAHKAILETICRDLLSGIVSDEKMEELICSAGGSEWQEAALMVKLEKNLGPALKPCLEAFEDVQNLIEQVRGLLANGTDDKARWDDYKKCKKQYKRIRAPLDKLVQEVRGRTADLQGLLQSNASSPFSTRAAQRRPLWRGPDFNIIRVRARTLYRTLQQSSRCSCPNHRLNLRLEAEQKARHGNSSLGTSPVSFHVKFAIGNHQLLPTPRSQWYSIEIEEIFEVRSQVLPSPQPSTAKTISGTSQALSLSPTLADRSRPSAARLNTGETPRRVRFHPSSNAPSSSASTQFSLVEQSSSCVADHSLQIQSLCDLPKASGSASVLFNNDGGRFRVLHRGSKADPQEDWVSLQDLLNKLDPNRPSLPHPTGPRLWRRNRLSLALNISIAFLQLHETDWLSQPLDSQTIFFVRDSAITETEQPYISKNFIQAHPTSMSQQSTPKETFTLRKELLFALGKLLLQLCFEKSWASLQIQEDGIGTLSNRVSDGFTAKRLLGEVCLEESQRYAAAVRYCIEWEFDPDNELLEEQKFQKVVCDQVLCPLQEDLSNFSAENLMMVY